MTQRTVKRFPMVLFIFSFIGVIASTHAYGTNLFVELGSIPTVITFSERPQVPITGKVADQNGEGIPGATVLIEGTTTGTSADIEGNFSIDAPEGAVLLVSYIGYQSQRITVDNQTSLTITLEENLSTLNEVVIATVPKKEVI